MERAGSVSLGTAARVEVVEEGHITMSYCLHGDGDDGPGAGTGSVLTCGQQRMKLQVRFLPGLVLGFPKIVHLRSL